ncbi:MAG: hypothetical protein M1826_003022 [Phylliscum demangeonii]|nr:MAG: hypothetical protein M1826_003022 [Phylliscum demangeonii]
MDRLPRPPSDLRPNAGEEHWEVDQGPLRVEVSPADDQICVKSSKVPTFLLVGPAPSLTRGSDVAESSKRRRTQIDSPMDSENENRGPSAAPRVRRRRLLSPRTSASSAGSLPAIPPWASRSGRGSGGSAGPAATTYLYDDPTGANGEDRRQWPGPPGGAMDMSPEARIDRFDPGEPNVRSARWFHEGPPPLVHPAGQQQPIGPGPRFFRSGRNVRQRLVEPELNPASSPTQAGTPRAFGVEDPDGPGTEQLEEDIREERDHDPYDGMWD